MVGGAGRVKDGLNLVVPDGLGLALPAGGVHDAVQFRNALQPGVGALLGEAAPLFRLGLVAVAAVCGSFFCSPRPPFGRVEVLLGDDMRLEGPELQGPVRLAAVFWHEGRDSNLHADR